MNFKEWLKSEGFTEPPPLGDPARRYDLVKGGLSRKDIPPQMRDEPITSAFPTYSLKQGKNLPPSNVGKYAIKRLKKG